MVRKLSIAAALFAALAVPPPPATAASAENGEAAFVRHGCWQCHGFAGQGSVATSAGRVIARTQLPFDTFKAYVRNPSGAMPPFRDKILSDADLADIYAFLQAQPPPAAVTDIPLLNDLAR